MRSVTRLTWLPGETLSSAYMKNFGLVDWDTIKNKKEIKKLWHNINCIVHDYYTHRLVSSCDLTNKSNLHSSEKEVQDKIMPV